MTFVKSFLPCQSQYFAQLPFYILELGNSLIQSGDLFLNEAYEALQVWRDRASRFVDGPSANAPSIIELYIYTSLVITVRASDKLRV